MTHPSKPETIARRAYKRALHSTCTLNIILLVSCLVLTLLQRYQNPEIMSQLETAMMSLMQVFDKYSGLKGKKDTLTNAELRALMSQELPAFTKGAKKQDEVSKLMEALDHNKDQEVDFKEFVIFVASLTCVCHDRSCSKK
ncbi:hypothetical protein AAFF_G00108320 [Aldrovandia affinis]|uniref:Protein S100 n=1 Tax=Aldrovandia affinis TaxID=143900 RepID=A0AAD7RTX5_9TELE|nr:hypothetical protein AAFF_G00108320 [Aldrovandia affinis]